MNSKCHTEWISRLDFFVIVLSLNANFVSPDAAPNLTPENIRSCVGQMVTATCVVPQGMAIRWEIDFVDLSVSDIQKGFLERDQPGETVNITNNRNYLFTFMLKSRDPLVTTVTTNMVYDLEGASVSCEDLSTAEVDTSLIHIISDISTNVSATASLVYRDPMENSILISIEWHQNPDVVPMLGTYTVLINSPIEVGYSFITMNTSIELIVHYNLEYNITVFTNSCAGSRNLVLVDFLFSIGRCSYPHTNPNVSVVGYDNGLENSQISYYCQSGYVPSERMIANCNSSGLWSPNPAELVCRAECATPALNRYVEIDVSNYPNHTTEGSIILFRCTDGFKPNLTIISICTREGKWKPNPYMHQCESVNLSDDLQFVDGSISIVNAVSTGVVCSIVMLIIGFACGYFVKTMIDRKGKCTERSITASNSGTAAMATNAIYETIQIHVSETNPQSEQFDIDNNQAYESTPVCV